MLRFVIALGSNSVPGGWLEREISKFYSLDEFDILSMPVQAELQPNDIETLKNSATGFIQRAKSVLSAEVYFGVAGATIPFYITKDSGPTAPARTDVVMRLTKDKQLPLRHLDEDDIRWQIAQRVVALVSTKRAVVNLTELIRRHCVAKALPKPR